MRRITAAVAVPVLLLVGLLTAAPARADVVSGGALTSGTPVTGTVSVANRDIQYTFGGTDGGHVTFDVTASNWGAGYAQLNILDPGGALYTYCNLATGPAGCEATLNGTGTWKAVLNPAGNATGSATFTFANDQNKGALAPGTAVTTTIGIHGQDAQYTFAGTAGSLATFNISAANWGNGSAYLYFFAPDGTFTSFCTVNTTDFCGFTPDTTGTWKVTLDPQESSIGSTTFTLVGDQNKGTLTPGTPVSTTISTPLQNANYSFAGVNGAHQTIDVTASNWGSGSAKLYVFQPGGTLYVSCTLANSPTLCEFTPNVTGTWAVQLDPQGSSVGSTTFTLAGDQNKGALSAGTALSTSISTRGQNATYTFPGTSGTHQTFDVTATNWGGGTALLKFYNPSGTQFTYCTLAATPTFCELTPDVTGSWKAVLDPQAAATGSTTFAFANDLNKGALSTGTPVSTTISFKGQNALYTVAGTSGVQVKLNVTATNWGGGTAWLFVFAPGGSLFTSCSLATTPLSCTFTPNATGTWTVRLDPVAGATGSMTVVKQ